MTNDPTTADCACRRGFPCDGATVTRRSAPKHGAVVRTSRPDCRGTGADRNAPGRQHWTTAQSAVDRCYARGAVAPQTIADNRVEAPLGALNAPRPARRVESLSAAKCWARRCAAGETLADRRPDWARLDAASAPQTTAGSVPAPMRRSPRGSLNTAVRGGATRALIARDHARNADADAATPPLTGRARRTAKRAAHKGRLNARG